MPEVLSAVCEASLGVLQVPDELCSSPGRSVDVVAGWLPVTRKHEGSFLTLLSILR